MLFSGIAAALAVLSLQTVAAQSCTNRVIDNFANYASNTNSLGEWTSDDGSMTSISASGNKLTFRPKSGSYFYETFPCQTATTLGFNAVSFSIKAPASASLALEIQTKSSCSASTYTSTYHQVTGISTTATTVTVPLSSFAGANLNAVTAFVWSGFSSTSGNWELSNVQFVCAAGGGQSSTSSSVPSTSSSVPSTSVTVPSSTLSSTVQPSSTGQCSNLLIDDWASQSRLTFLFYNAMVQSTSDDGTMKSVVVANNRVTLTPTNTNSYFYSKLGCTNAQNKYGGISLRIKAPAGTTFGVELGSSSNCGDDTNNAYQSTSQLGWTFDGTEKLYSIPFSKFSGIDLTKMNTLFFGSFNKAVTFGPMAFYCGTTVSEYIPTSTPAPSNTATVPAPSGTASAILIDEFANQNTNALGFWHGGDDAASLTWGNKQLKITSNDPDFNFYTQVSASCRDLNSHKGSYLHIAYSGSTKFTVALQQHNSQCSSTIAPYPETWDSLEASRYAKNGHIYIPISHFNINLSRVIGLALKAWYTNEPTTFTKIEIVSSVPSGTTIPAKLPSGNLVFACKRPNSFAFAIDDGIPEYAQEVMKIIREENIKVTFFTVGAPLRDQSTNLSNVYNEMMSQGHQVALHSYTHPKMEGLPDIASIDYEYNEDIAAVAEQLHGLRTPYFRPPFGNEGARMRQRLTATTGDDNAYIVNWSVDVEDWLWAETSTPEKQLEAFQRDVNKGGNLVVLHYLYPSTVQYLRQFIQIAKATGKQLMRVDQCMMDPNAPPL